MNILATAASSQSHEGWRAYVLVEGQTNLAGRTRRALLDLGFSEVGMGPAADIPSGAVVIARAGSWLRQRSRLVLGEPSAGFVGLVPTAAAGWQAWQRRTGGYASGRGRWRFWERVPELPMLALAESERLRNRLKSGLTWEIATAQLLREPYSLLYTLPGLVADWRSQLRVLQVVTSIQIGGAERIACDLAEELNYQGCATAVAALGEPTRKKLADPRYFFRLANSISGQTTAARTSAIFKAASQWGADVIHAHLLKGSEIKALRENGWPVVVTVHNDARGWPDGLCDAENAPNLMLGCAQAVSQQLHASGVQTPVRTVWNGIVPSRYAVSDPQKVASPILLVLANFRPQKRLGVLPEMLAELHRMGCPAQLWIAGEPSRGSEAITAELALGFAERSLQEHVKWLGGVENVPALLPQIDILVSTSAWEGLSLAHLEALAAGKRVVATEVGGTAEIAARHPHLHLVSPEAEGTAMADGILACWQMSAPEPVPWPPAFSRHLMAKRTERLYRSVLRVPKEPVKPNLWLVANNFATGGAQTSARRLLESLHTRGYAVGAMVIQEHAEFPTEGTRHLHRLGIPVISVAGPTDAALVVEKMLPHIADAPQTCVVFWNAIAAHKLLLADVLLWARIVDVSPGGMWFSSMEKYFTRPRPDVPWSAAKDYGQRLSTMVVKYERERSQAEEYLACPVVTIPNGVPQVPAVEKVRNNGDRVVFGTAARISPDKKLEELLAALQQVVASFPHCELWVAGGADGGSEAYFKTLVAASQRLPVKWLGHQTDTRAFHSQLDVFVMISEPAGCPNASLEALASGLPVILTDIGGANEQVVDGQSGLLVKAADAKALADAMLHLARNPERREALAVAGQEYVRQHFSMEKMTEAYRQLFFPS